jgi:hypothetical protein
VQTAAQLEVRGQQEPQLDQEVAAVECCREPEALQERKQKSHSQPVLQDWLETAEVLAAAVV